MALVEKVRGRTFSQPVYLRYWAIGLALFIFLMYFGLRNDLLAGQAATLSGGVGSERSVTSATSASAAVRRSSFSR